MRTKYGCGIYSITNTANGKCYVGQSVSITRRWDMHKSCLRRGIHQNAHLQRSWDKHVDFMRWQAAEHSDKPGEVERGKQVFIAKCLVDADGNPALTEAKSLHLTAEGVNVLFPLALEVNGLIKRKDPGNGSGEAAPNTSSDTSP